MELLELERYRLQAYKEVIRHLSLQFYIQPGSPRLYALYVCYDGFVLKCVGIGVEECISVAVYGGLKRVCVCVCVCVG